MKRSGRVVRAFTAVALGALTLVASAETTAAANPGPLHTVIGTKLLGRSNAGRPIMAYHLGDPRSRVKAVVVGQMHGDEHAGVIVAQSIVHGPPIRGIDLWVVPTMNPDGDVRHTRGNLHGVDLNRNWPDIWVPLGGMFYSGPRPMTEPETRAMYRFLTTVRPTHLVVLHQPLNGVDTTDGGTRNVAFRNRLARTLGLPLKAFRCGGVCHGSMTGWLTAHQPGSAITVEFGTAPTRSYLTRIAPRGILSSLGARYDTVAAHNPRAHVDAASASGSTVRFAGWALDPDSLAGSITVRVLEGSTVRWQQPTSGYRPDVNLAYRATGNHGLDAQFAAANGTHTYCVQFVNVGPGSADPRWCRTLTVNGTPVGHLDSVTSPAAGTAHLVGWTVDPDASAVPSQVRITVDGAGASTVTADTARPDVDSALHVSGNHGFDVSLTGQSAGTHTYCVTALNAGPAAPDQQLGCVAIAVSG